MFDFRYHALSLVAVFLALGIGLLLGIAIGDSGLVSSAESDLRSSLRGDVGEARAEQRRLQEELDRHQSYEMQSYPLLVGSRLIGRRVAVLTLHSGGDQTFEEVRAAITPAGGQVASVSRLRLAPDVGALAAATAGTRFEPLETDPELLEALGRRIGQQIVIGGSLLEDVRQAVFSSSSGSLAGVDGVVLIREEPSEAAREDDEAVRSEELLIDGLLAGIQSAGTPVVGVERTDTDPSQIGWYQSQGMASVDNVDQVAGRTALVLALAVGADGSYGIKATRDALLPETTTGEP